MKTPGTPRRAGSYTIKKYRDGVADIANRVKHEHGQLRFVAFYDAVATVPGYY